MEKMKQIYQTNLDKTKTLKRANLFTNKLKKTVPWYAKFCSFLQMLQYDWKFKTNVFFFWKLQLKTTPELEKIAQLWYPKFSEGNTNKFQNSHEANDFIISHIRIMKITFELWKWKTYPRMYEFQGFRLERTSKRENRLFIFGALKCQILLW